MTKPKKPAKKPSKNKESAQARRAKFVAAYFTNGENSTQAAIAIGLSAKTASSQGSRMMKEPWVKEEVAKERARLADMFKLSPEKVLREVARISYSDPRRFFDGNGALIPLHLMDADTAASIASIEVFEEFEGVGPARTKIGETKKIKCWDKNPALDKAMKHLGLYEKDNEQVSAQVIMVPLKAVSTNVKSGG